MVAGLRGVAVGLPLHSQDHMVFGAFQGLYVIAAVVLVVMRDAQQTRRATMYEPTLEEAGVLLSALIDQFLPNAFAKVSALCANNEGSTTATAHRSLAGKRGGARDEPLRGHEAAAAVASAGLLGPGAHCRLGRLGH